MKLSSPTTKPKKSLNDLEEQNLSYLKLPVKKKALVIDDEDSVRNCLRRLFEMHGFEVHEAWSNQQAFNLAQQHQPCLVLLDLNLGTGECGFELCKQLRTIQNSCKMKIFIMTGFFKDPQSQITGYNYGADAYITKPFDPNVLIALVNAKLRKCAALNKKVRPYSSNFSQGDEIQSSTVIEKCGFSVDISKNSVWYDGKLIEPLTSIEFSILICLLKHSPDAVTRKTFLKELWTKATVAPKAIDVHIHNLKSKLPSSASKKILAIPKQGYRIIG